MRGMNLTIVVGIIMLAIVIITFPIILDAIGEVTGHASIADFTGLEAIANVTPILLWVGAVIMGGYLTFTGVKTARSGGSRKRR